MKKIILFLSLISAIYADLQYSVEEASKFLMKDENFKSHLNNEIISLIETYSTSIDKTASLDPKILGEKNIQILRTLNIYTHSQLNKVENLPFMLDQLMLALSSKDNKLIAFYLTYINAQYIKQISLEENIQWQYYKNVLTNNNLAVILKGDRLKYIRLNEMFLQSSESKKSFQERLNNYTPKILTNNVKEMTNKIQQQLTDLKKLRREKHLKILTILQEQTVLKNTKLSPVIQPLQEELFFTAYSNILDSLYTIMAFDQEGIKSFLDEFALETVNANKEQFKKISQTIAQYKDSFSIKDSVLFNGLLSDEKSDIAVLVESPLFNLKLSDKATLYTTACILNELKSTKQKYTTYTLEELSKESNPPKMLILCLNHINHRKTRSLVNKIIRKVQENSGKVILITKNSSLSIANPLKLSANKALTDSNFKTNDIVFSDDFNTLVSTRVTNVLIHNNDFNTLSNMNLTLTDNDKALITLKSKLNAKFNIGALFYQNEEPSHIILPLYTIMPQVISNSYSSFLAPELNQSGKEIFAKSLELLQ